MEPTDTFEIFAIALPGLEPALAEEVAACGFAAPSAEVGGVRFSGGWPEVWRANLDLRGATKVLVRIGGFPALHLAQLDKRARKFPWGTFLRPDVPVKVEATCRGSRIYHAGAAAQRVERALTEELGVSIQPDAPIRLMARIDDNLCTFSIDSSGEPLHRRGTKEFVGKAPLRETLAALFLRQCGYAGKEPVVDPMCGSGTFLLEAAAIAAGQRPGRARAFAFEQLAGFDPESWAALRQRPEVPVSDIVCHGFDRDDGAVRGAAANAERAGLSGRIHITRQAVSDLQPPEGPAGLVMVNPPYGARIGNRKLLFGLYGALGKVLADRFSGWRVGMVTSDDGLARATGLPLNAGSTVPHGGLKIRLYQTGPLA